MSDSYQVVADLDADSRTAEELADRVRNWMIAQKIIVPGISDCVLSGPGGHAPGENYALAVERPTRGLLKLRTNGARFIAKRSVFYSIGNPNKLVCTDCRGQFQGGDSWSEAIDEWYSDKGTGLLACELCGAKRPITEWEHDPSWAFGHVGVQFWNWPRFRADFVAKVGEILGHRVRLVWGRL
jgi:hypothetical protein